VAVIAAMLLVLVAAVGVEPAAVRKCRCGHGSHQQNRALDLPSELTPRGVSSGRTF